jgi:60 kDa SS-A/Ro ribonucleoprotein
VKTVVKALHDSKKIKDARIHPIAIISALMTYNSGHGARDTSKTWSPIAQISDALDDAFYLSFKEVVPTNKGIMLALDVSGSMGWADLAGVPGLTPAKATAVLSLVTAHVEPKYAIKAFTSSLSDLNITKKSRLEDAMREVNCKNFGSTDCAQPMLWAAKNKIKLDAFSVYTDSETWAGDIHPVQALEQYKQKMGIDAKLIVVGMVSNSCTIADPKNPRMLDVVGFDTNTPSVISEFIR